jgi:hypothetical protein
MTVNSTYYGRGIETPMVGEEPPVRRPTSPQFSEEEAALRPGEDAKAYLARLAALAAQEAPPPRTVRSRTQEADELWIEQHAQLILKARAIERPTYAERAAATVAAAALLARARASSDR